MIVNLVDQKKAEGRLEASLKSIHKQVTSRFLFSFFFWQKRVVGKLSLISKFSNPKMELSKAFDKHELTKMTTYLSIFFSYLSTFFVSNVYLGKHSRGLLRGI